MFKNDEVTGQSLMTYCASERIKWIFNPPASPWMGGVWERLVGSVKKALNKAVGRRKLSFTEMSTVITRIEAILNTRPLTKINVEDITKIPLRPVDFLQGNVKFSLPEKGPNQDKDDPLYDPELIQSRKQAEEAILFSEMIANKFWNCWKQEYLVSLREMQKQRLKQPKHLQRSCPEKGEIVLIEQELVPRGTWSYGRITEIVESNDGLVRTAKVLMPNHKIIHRPLNKIYPLEIRSPPDTIASLTPASSSETPHERQSLPRSSKTLAREFFKTLDCAITHSKSSLPTTSLMMLMTLMAVMSPILATTELPFIWCGNGVVHVPPIKGWLEICITDECQSFINKTQPSTYLLPISPTGMDIDVRLRTHESSGLRERTLVCDRAKFCDHQHFLSKTLLGNPHCWPLDAS
ncbi:hypothetical protein V3C99_018111, partial [Haemonchus contortus]